MAAFQNEFPFFFPLIPDPPHSLRAVYKQIFVSQPSLSPSYKSHYFFSVTKLFLKRRRTAIIFFSGPNFFARVRQVSVRFIAFSPVCAVSRRFRTFGKLRLFDPTEVPQ